MPAFLQWQSLLPMLVVLPTAANALTFSCDKIVEDKITFDLSPLSGPKTVHWQQWVPPSISNTTFTIDLCAPLKKVDGVGDAEQCPSGTRICGIETTHSLVDKTPHILKVIPIAGQYVNTNGRLLDPNITRLKTSSDSTEEGLRIQLHGGKYPDTSSGQKQSAIIDMICDPDKTGNEGFAEQEASKQERSLGLSRRDESGDDGDNKEPELPDLDKDKSLQFVNYEKSEKSDVLRLKWHTKYACEQQAGKEPSGGKQSAGWGFFTWLLIIVFLLVAAYIIFGSWLNYNRYGARGWDLVPHGDMIRDIPYIVKDWASGVNERLRGGASRGGYSAV